MINLSLVSVSMSDSDKRLLIILIIILFVLFLLLGFLGIAIHKTMVHQAEKVDTIMSDAARTHVVDSPKSFKSLAMRKSNRLLYKQTLIPFAISVVALLIWVFCSLGFNTWTENIFAHFSELFFHYEWNASAEIYRDDPLIVKVFGISMLARFPAVTHKPTFVLEHLPAYIEVALFYVSWIWYAYLCQAWISRFVMIQHRARTIYSKSLKDFKAEEDIKYTQKDPTPPSQD